MELRHLRYFVVVAEEMHFRRAAEKLNMTQPPLSQQIQQLEQELGFDLFIRRGRSIALTEAGRVFLEEAQSILRSVDEAVIRASRVAEGKAGNLNVGFVESAVHHGLPEIITQFRSNYHDAVVTLNRMTSNEQLGALSDKSIDIGFCRARQEDIQAPLVAETIILEAMCAVLSRSHDLVDRESLQLKDLANEAFILFPQNLGTSLYAHIADACERSGFTLILTQEATQFTTIVGLVAANMGVSVLPVSVMTFPHDNVHYVTLSEVDPVPMSLVWHRDNQSPLFKNFHHLTQGFYDK